MFSSSMVRRRKKLSRAQFHEFMAEKPAERGDDGDSRLGPFLGSADDQAGTRREIDLAALRQAVLKRQKNDAADAEAIVDAAQRPEMRFVEIKTEAQQTRAVLFRNREQLVRQPNECLARVSL